eukprot:5328081-Prymnesium_polylepis.1
MNEMCAREVPWDGYGPLDIKAKVVEGDRPAVPTATPSAVSSLIRAAWDGEARERPTFEAAALKLRTIEETLPTGAAALGVIATDDALDALLR